MWENLGFTSKEEVLNRFYYGFELLTVGAMNGRNEMINPKDLMALHTQTSTYVRPSLYFRPYFLTYMLWFFPKLISFNCVISGPYESHDIFCF